MGWRVRVQSLMRAYYNEIDPYAADWLRRCIAAGLIAPGDVDERSIVDVQPDDLRGYTQCHFFAGIGGWSYAARLAGIPDDQPLWTGSCPCQPFSAAGKQRGTDDARHLWPEFFRLVRECRPATAVGEQVASRLGREWLAGVFTDLESVGYAVAGADLCAASCAAPHIRQRLWWVADAGQFGSAGRGVAGDVGGAAFDAQGEARQWQRCRDAVDDGGADGEWLEHPASDGRRERWPESGGRRTASGCGAGGWLGDADDARSQGRRDDAREYTSQRTPWAASLDCWVPCLDGKARRLEPGLEPLVDGLPFRLADGRTVETASRKELLRGLGNAIVPQVAATFLKAALA